MEEALDLSSERILNDEMSAHIASCFVRLSQQTATLALYNTSKLFFITEVESVYSAVRTESLHKTDTFSLQMVNALNNFMLQSYNDEQH